MNKIIQMGQDRLKGPTKNWLQDNGRTAFVSRAKIWGEQEAIGKVKEYIMKRKETHEGREAASRASLSLLLVFPVEDNLR